MKKSIAKNYIYNLIYQLLTILLPFITTPYLSRVLGAENIGIYGYTISIVTYFVLLGTLGISMYGQREIAYVQESKKDRSKIFWEIIITRAITLSVSSFIYFFIYGTNGSYAVYYKILLIQLIANFFDISWFFQGVEEFDKTVIRNLIVKAISLVLIFLWVKTEHDLWKYFVIFVGSELIGNITLWMYIPKYVSKIQLKNITISKHIKNIIILFIPQVATQIYTVLDKTMIGNITNDMNAVGFYEQAQKIMKAGLLIVTSMGTVMTSRVSNMFINKNKEEINGHLYKSFNFVWAISLPIIFGMSAICKYFVPIFYGSGYDEVIPLLSYMCILILVIGLSNVTGVQYLIPIKKQKEYTISVTVGCIVNVIANFLLIGVCGTIGAVIASIIAEISVLLVQLIYIRKSINIKKIFKMSKEYLIASIIMYVFVVFITKLFNSNLLKLLIGSIVGVITYCIILVVLRDSFTLELFNKIKNKVLNGGEK